MEMTSAQQTQRNCVSCGRSIDWNASICQYCGHDYRYQARITQPPKKNNTVLWIVVIVVILVVVLPIVMAAMMYFMVLGFGGEGQTTPQATYATQTITNGKKITILSLTADNIQWDDVTIVLTDDTGNSANWMPMMNDLDDNAGDLMNYTGKALGTLTVACTVFDNIGNGFLDDGDYILLRTYGGAPTFVSGHTYDVRFLYEPTGDQIGISVIWTA